MRDIVERFTHTADQRLVLLQDAIELTCEFRQFALRLALGHALRQIAGIDDCPGRPHHFTNGRSRSVSEERTPDQAKEKSGRHHKQKRTQKGAQQRLASVDASANLQNRTIAQDVLAMMNSAARILGNLQPGIGACVVFVDRTLCRPDPILRRHQQQETSLRTGDPDEKWALVLFKFRPMN